MSKEYITKIVTNWLEWAKPFVCNKVTEILLNVQSFATLRHLNQLSTVIVNRDIVLCFIIICFFKLQVYPQHWTAISEQISFESDLWSELYCPLFAQRTKVLLTNHWDNVFPIVISDINNALQQ